jgi:hypothetical protein
MSERLLLALPTHNLDHRSQYGILACSQDIFSSVRSGTAFQAFGYKCRVLHPETDTVYTARLKRPLINSAPYC